MSTGTSCASANERIHSSSSNCSDVGSSSFFQEHQLRVEQEERGTLSGKSPVTHWIVRMSRPRKRRPPLARVLRRRTMASRCSCRSEVGTGGTHRRQFDVRTRLKIREKSDDSCNCWKAAAHTKTDESNKKNQLEKHQLLCCPHGCLQSSGCKRPGWLSAQVVESC